MRCPGVARETTPSGVIHFVGPGAMLAVARLLSAVGLRTFDPERVRKLDASTNIQAHELSERGS